MIISLNHISPIRTRTSTFICINLRLLMKRYPFAIGLLLACLILTGCSESAPPVYPITGKVTFAGKAHPRLLVYFRPVDTPVNQFGANMGVGETDAEGNLKVMSAAGGGIQKGKYKVTFALYQDIRGKKNIVTGDKPDEAGVTTKQVISPPYDDESSQQSTPVSITVSSGTNQFNFDIPAK